jgi:hypothetical protein
MSLDDRGLIDYFRKQSNGDPQSEEIKSLDQLMLLHDEAFVDAAFRVLFKRPADESGLGYYADRLRRGFCRISVLDQLTRSSEVRPDWQGFPGLFASIKRFRKSRKLAGWSLALNDPELGVTPSLRRARILQNSLGAQRQILVQAVQKIEGDNHHRNEALTQLPFPAATPTLKALEPVRFEPPHARRINDVRHFDVPDQIRTVVGLLHL